MIRGLDGFYVTEIDDLLGLGEFRLGISPADGAKIVIVVNKSFVLFATLIRELNEFTAYKRLVNIELSMN